MALPIWKELIEDERRYREKLIKIRAKRRRMPTHAECLDAMKELLAEKREREHAAIDRDFEKAKAELTRGGGLVSRRFEWCKNWRDIFEEWDEILWV